MDTGVKCGDRLCSSASCKPFQRKTLTKSHCPDAGEKGRKTKQLSLDLNFFPLSLASLTEGHNHEQEEARNDEANDVQN